MAITIFTHNGLLELDSLIEKNKKQLSLITKRKGESAAGQDGWHDEGYKSANVEEMMWSKHLRELQELRQTAVVITPEEQNDQVKIGNGVLLKYSDGTEKKYIIDGYMVNPTTDRVSYGSPTGGVLLGCHEGDVVRLKIDKNYIAITIIKIIAPSKTQAFLSEGGN